MLDNLTEEERAELEAQCDLWQAEAIAAQDAEMSEKDWSRKSLSISHLGARRPPAGGVSRWLSVTYVF